MTALLEKSQMVCLQLTQASTVSDKEVTLLSSFSPLFVSHHLYHQPQTLLCGLTFNICVDHSHYSLYVFVKTLPSSITCSCLLTAATPHPSWMWQFWTGASWARRSVWSMEVLWWESPASTSLIWPSCLSSSSLAPIPWPLPSRSSSSAATSPPRW